MKNNDPAKLAEEAESRRGFLKAMGLSAAALSIGGAMKNKVLNNGLISASEPAQPNVPTVPVPGSEDKKASKSDPYGFKYFVGIVGSPSIPNISWSDKEIKEIKSLGVNMLQLSIAWGGRPADEVLNLEDLDSEQVKKWKFRVKQAQKFGLSTIAQFGIPKLLYTANGYSIVQPACILAPDVREKYSKLLGGFLDRFPAVDNVLVYTYDQDAWLCSEFGPCPRCSGIPLPERLIGFLDFLNGVMQKHRPGGTLWWKPWEISNGETITIVKEVNASHFGLVLNSSSANEAYPFNDRAFKSDLAIKRTVQVASDRKIPVIGEIDYTLYKGYYLFGDYFPRFVYEQLQNWKEMNGLVGVKEYFGFAPANFSVNAAMLKACMRSPNATLEQLLLEIADPYGKKAASMMIDAWEYVARGVEAFPWDVTYLIGQLGLNKGDNGSHSWDPVTIANGTWNTPAWKTNRRANFMMTKDSKAHPWLFEDVGLQLEDSASLLFKAVDLFKKAKDVGRNVNDIKMQLDSIQTVARAVRGKSLHFLETLAAQDARLVGYDPKQWRLVVNRLDGLLEKDVANQGGNADVVKKLQEFQNDPHKWLQENLNPLAYQTICNVDWSKYVPYQNIQP